MTNVLILGAGGQVARHVIDRLSKNDSVHLTLYLRNASRLQHLQSGQIKLVEGDILETEKLKKAMQGQDLVYVNINGKEDVLAQEIVNAMQTTKVRRLIFIAVVTGDLSDIEETKNLAREVNALGAFDAVIHNAGVYQTSAKNIFAVNILAPYILTCLIQKPKRLIYLSSGMHLQGRLKLDNFKTDITRITYSDSKLFMVMLCMAIARKWKDVYSSAVDPGWVPTKMGGRGAPDDLQKGYETQVWLAVSNDEKAKLSGRYFFHRKERHHNPEADDVQSQEIFLNLCREITGVSFS